MSLSKLLLRSKKLSCTVHFCDKSGSYYNMQLPALIADVLSLSSRSFSKSTSLSCWYKWNAPVTEGKERFSGISSIDTQALTSVVKSLLCGKLKRYKSIMSIVEVKVMELKIYIIVLTFPQLLWQSGVHYNFFCDIALFRGSPCPPP